jgi:hypothetical protein
MEYCGIKSFIFQEILGLWTFLMFAVGLFIALASRPNHEQAEAAVAGGFWNQIMTKWILGGMCCPLSTWGIVALPLLIAAIATLKSK